MDEVISYVDTRAAEVATTTIASDVAQVHQDMLDADADASAAAASAAAAAGTLANAVKKTGEASQSIAGDIAISGALSVSGAVTVPAPTGNTNAANKKYVDDKDALDVHLAGSEAITGAKTVPLEATGTYSNQIASSNKVKNELDNYQAMMRLANLQTYTGVKELVKTANNLPSFVKISDASASEHPDLIYLTGIRDNDGRWLAEDRLGTDNNGARGYYSKNFKLYANSVEYTVSVRMNLTATGVQIQVFDPVNTAWRTVQLS